MIVFYTKVIYLTNRFVFTQLSKHLFSILLNNLKEKKWYSKYLTLIVNLLFRCTTFHSFLRLLVTLKQYIWISQTGTFLVYAFNTLSTRHQISLFSKQCSTVLRAVIQSQILRSTDPSMWKCMTHMNSAMIVWTSSMCQHLELDMSNNFVVNHL